MASNCPSARSSFKTRARGLKGATSPPWAGQPRSARSLAELPEEVLAQPLALRRASARESQPSWPRPAGRRSFVPRNCSVPASGASQYLHQPKPSRLQTRGSGRLRQRPRRLRQPLRDSVTAAQAPRHTAPHTPRIRLRPTTITVVGRGRAIRVRPISVLDSTLDSVLAREYSSAEASSVKLRTR